MKQHSRLLILAFSLAVVLPVQSEVVHHQISATDKFVRVTADDDWHPEGVEHGTTVPATYFKQVKINLDGKDDEPEWTAVKEVILPMNFGNIRQAWVKALYTDNEVFIRVRWPDNSENRQHKPWVWDPVQERYVIGAQIEDSLLLSFEAGCEWAPSLLSGNTFDFDGWHWLAARSDPVNQAWDLAGFVAGLDSNSSNASHVYQSRNTGGNWNIKFDRLPIELTYKNWNELKRRYMFITAQPMVAYSYELDGKRKEKPEPLRRLPAPSHSPVDFTRTFPQFEAVKLTGSAGEIGAKGHWQDGFWTVEFRRNLVTPALTENDTVFTRLTQFTIHAFDATDRIDETSESKRLYLQFLPNRQIVVNN